MLSKGCRFLGKNMVVLNLVSYSQGILKYSVSICEDLNLLLSDYSVTTENSLTNPDSCLRTAQLSRRNLQHNTGAHKMRKQSGMLPLGEETLSSYPVSFPWHCLHTFCWALPQRGTTALKLRQPEQNDRPQLLHPHCGDTSEGQDRASPPSPHTHRCCGCVGAMPAPRGTNSSAGS